MLCVFRAWLSARRGYLAAVAPDVAVAVEPPPVPVFFRFAGLAALLEALVEIGDLERAEHEAAAAWVVDDRSVLYAVQLVARARLRLAQARPSEALADALDAGARFERLQARSPGPAAWRSTAALAHLALGERDAARPLADEEAGSPRPPSCHGRSASRTVRRA